MNQWEDVMAFLANQAALLREAAERGTDAVRKSQLRQFAGQLELVAGQVEETALYVRELLGEEQESLGEEL